MRTLAIAAIALLAAVTVGSAALAASQSVTIEDFNFSPANVTVNAGDSVTWRNAGGEAHTATANNGGFDAGVLNPGASKTIIFGTAGTFEYHCAIHPYMHGTVTVLAAVATTAPPTPPPTAPATLAPTDVPTALPTRAPTAPPTVAPTASPTAAPTTTPTPAPTTAAPTATAVAIASASAAPTTSATSAPTPAPANDAGPLPLVAGVVLVVGITGGALYALRRR